MNRLLLVVFLSTALFGENPYLPQSYVLIEREGMIIAYDYRLRNAKWTYEQLTADLLRGTYDLERAFYKTDPEVPKVFRTGLDDYRNSGYDRGHLCPFADQRSSEKRIADCFYLSNVSPQLPRFNRGLWGALEEYVRGLTERFDVLHVLTIPLYLASAQLVGKRFVHYELLGKSEIAVPTHFGKVVFAEIGPRKEVFAWILPNAALPKGFTLDYFEVSLEEIEKASGLIWQIP